MLAVSDTSPLLYRMLRWQVDHGEAEAIAPAADLEADIVIIDEQEGRALARQAGLSVTGTLGVLLRAKRFFLAASLEAEVLSAAGE